MATRKTNVSFIDGVNDKSQATHFDQLLAEEDEIYFEACCSHTTLNFVVPSKRLYQLVLIVLTIMCKCAIISETFGLLHQHSFFAVKVMANCKDFFSKF